MAELLLKWRVRKLTGHCGERSFSACLCTLSSVLLCGGCVCVCVWCGTCVVCGMGAVCGKAETHQIVQ